MCLKVIVVVQKYVHNYRLSRQLLWGYRFCIVLHNLPLPIILQVYSVIIDLLSFTYFLMIVLKILI